MAKVYGLHMIAFRPGVTGEDFEKYFREKVRPAPAPRGWKMHLLKGDRGDREGRYLVMIEIESLEAHNRIVPTADQPSDEGKRFFEEPEARAIFDEWDRLATSPGSSTIFTDYVVVA